MTTSKTAAVKAAAVIITVLHNLKAVVFKVENLKVKVVKECLKKRVKANKMVKVVCRQMVKTERHPKRVLSQMVRLRNL